MGNLIILFAALFAVIQRNYQNEINIRINPGLVGLSISYALQVYTHIISTHSLTYMYSPASYIGELRLYSNYICSVIISTVCVCVGDTGFELGSSYD